MGTKVVPQATLPFSLECIRQPSCQAIPLYIIPWYPLNASAFFVNRDTY